MIKQDATNTQRTEADCMPAMSGKIGYHIRLKDHLDSCWWHRFEGWSFTNLNNGELLLSAHVDQSALHGALNIICDLNLTLLSVTRVDDL